MQTRPRPNGIQCTVPAFWNEMRARAGAPARTCGSSYASQRTASGPAGTGWSGTCSTRARLTLPRMGAEFVLDTPLVREFVGSVDRAIAEASSPQDACDVIRHRFAELLADPAWLPAEYQAAAPESGMGGGIGQWLLCRADDRSLSLFSLVVPPAAETPIHDHLAWGLVGLYRGTQDEEIYAQRSGALELVEQRPLHPGDFYVLIPPHADIHRV